MSDKKMTLLCDCGQQFTVLGITSEEYRKWKTFDTRPLARAFPHIDSKGHDQLLMGQCDECHEDEWGGLD